MSDADLVSGELTLTSRIRSASNATYLGAIGEVEVVYKPIAGESPLWDFPDGALAYREVAAYLVSQALDWDVVPHTWLRDGPAGEGMVQLWKDQDPDHSAVDLFTAEEVPDAGWKRVLEGVDQEDRRVALVHEDSAELRRMAIFDAMVNNADRKGDHVLTMSGAHRYGVDHGLTFHSDHKLRTVLWGWAGEELNTEEIAGIQRVTAALAGDLGRDLAQLLTGEELAAFAIRCLTLETSGEFPAPSGMASPVPWPLF